MTFKTYYLFIYDNSSALYYFRPVRLYEDGSYYFNNKTYKRWRNMFNAVVRNCLNRNTVSSDLYNYLWTDLQLSGINSQSVIHSR